MWRFSSGLASWRSRDAASWRGRFDRESWRRRRLRSVSESAWEIWSRYMTPLQLRAAKIVGCTIPTLNQNKAFSLYFSNPNSKLFERKLEEKKQNKTKQNVDQHSRIEPGGRPTEICSRSSTPPKLEKKKSVIKKFNVRAVAIYVHEWLRMLSIAYWKKLVTPLPISIS